MVKGLFLYRITLNTEWPYVQNHCVCIQGHLVFWSVWELPLCSELLIMLLIEAVTFMTQSISLCLTADSNKPNSTCDRCVAPLTPCRSNTSGEHSFSCNFCTWPRPDAFLVRKVWEWSGAGVVTLAAEVDTDIICRHTQSTLQMLTTAVTFLATEYLQAALLEKVKAPQLLKKFPAFYGPQRFITTFTKACHFFLYYVPN